MRTWPFGCVVIGLAVVGALAGCGKEEAPVSKYSGPMQAGTIRVTSPAFAPGAAIPRKHAYEGEGENLSPPLEWTGVPAATKEIALVVDDPDAPGANPFVHWVLLHLPPTTTSLPEGFHPGTEGAVEGRNGFGETRWGGPMPPSGSGTHHYRFRVFALDAPLEVPVTAGSRQLESGMRGHVLAEGYVVGTYEIR